MSRFGKIIMPGSYDTEGDFYDALHEEEEAARAAADQAENDAELNKED
jgi:hypothetical protein